MKKLFFLVVVLSLGFVSMSHAQSSLSKGSGLVNVGAGFFPGVGGNASYDYGLIDHWGPGLFTVGGYFSAAIHTDTYGSTKYKRTKLFFAPRATYRYSINPKFEIFGSVMTGLLVKETSIENQSYVAFGLMGGCRYFFTNNFGVFAEGGVNYETTCLNLGVSFAF
ncbi:hypothetical protein FACS189430_04530 [Bacteroidia bacterium]|nr:hypothetical protein FACS189430_04530 [Bacteroidia bacterium]